MKTETQLIAESMGLKLANLEIELAQYKAAYQQLKQEKEELEQQLSEDIEIND